MEFRPHPLKQLNPVAIPIIISILNLSFHCSHWNSDPTPPALSLNTLEFLSYPLKQWNSGPFFVHIGILSSSFKTLQFSPYLYTHWNPNLILLSNGILALFCYILEFGSHPYKHWTSSLIFITWNSHLILPNVGILAPFYKHWNSHWIHSYFGILALFFADWNFQLILPSIWILALFLQTLEFLSYPFTGNIKILALSFQTMEFWPNIYIHWFSDLNSGPISISIGIMLPKNGILILSF